MNSTLEAPTEQKQENQSVSLWSRSPEENEQLINAIQALINCWDDHNRIVGSASIISKVTTPQQNERAVRVLQAIDTFEASINEIHSIVKKPAWDYCVQVDELKRERLKLPKQERFRIATLSGNYLAIEEAKTRSLNNVRNEDLSQLEREREAELSRVGSDDERDRIQEEYANRAAALPKAEAPKVKGQRLKVDWEIEIIDPVAFVANHPHLANVSVAMREAKALLDAGQTIKGVRATRINKSVVKAAKVLNVPSTVAQVPDAPAASIASVGNSDWVETPHSSQIARFCYHPSQLILTITFKTGATYHYYQVPPEVFAAFRASDSAGSYFGRAIKGVFGFKKAS